MSYHPVVPKRIKTELERLLEESIKLAREGGFPKRDSLGKRLRRESREMPDSLADPDEIALLADVDAEEW